jgi:hypothetical protein
MIFGKEMPILTHKMYGITVNAQQYLLSYNLFMVRTNVKKAQELHTAKVIYISRLPRKIGTGKF